MSNIGRKAILIPPSVEILVQGQIVKIKGPKGEVTVLISPLVGIERGAEGLLTVKRKNNTTQAKISHGLARAQMANAVQGVSVGFEKKLIIKGVGYRAQSDGKKIILSLGYSHPIEIDAPPGITLKIEKNVIAVSGINKETVGQTAAVIRSKRKPDAYKGKGIAYIDEIIKLKPGKAAKSSTGAATGA